MTSTVSGRKVCEIRTVTGNSTQICQALVPDHGLDHIESNSSLKLQMGTDKFNFNQNSKKGKFDIQLLR